MIHLLDYIPIMIHLLNYIPNDESPTLLTFTNYMQHSKYDLFTIIY